MAGLVVGGSLDCSDRNMIELWIWRRVGKVSSRIRIQDLRTASFHLFRRLVGRIPWITTMKKKGAQESLKIFLKKLNDNSGMNHSTVQEDLVFQQEACLAKQGTSQ